MAAGKFTQSTLPTVWSRAPQRQTRPDVRTTRRQRFAIPESNREQAEGCEEGSCPPPTTEAELLGGCFGNEGSDPLPTSSRSQHLVAPGRQEGPGNANLGPLPTPSTGQRQTVVATEDGSSPLETTRLSWKRRLVVQDLKDKDNEEDGGVELYSLPTPFTDGRQQAGAPRQIKSSGSVDEDYSPLTVSRPSKRHRLVIQDSDDEEDVASFPSRRQRDVAPAGGSSDEEDIDDDVDIEKVEDAGDETLIPGPDDEDEDEGGTELLHSVADGVAHPIIPSPTPDTPFARILRQILSQLVEFAKGNFLVTMKDPNIKAMTLGYCNLLRWVSIDYLIGIYRSGIPQKVQMLFEKNTWALQDLLLLPKIERRDKRQGIYGNFATGKIDRLTSIRSDGYIGSTRCFQDRIGAHLSIASRYSVRELTGTEYEKSFHYRQIARDGVVSNFRCLAAFEIPLEKGYLLLLESIFMILFGTYKHPGYTSHWATGAPYDLTEKIRSSLNIVDITWHGMNAAFPLVQGFVNRRAHTPSPCANPNCGRMTYPRNLITEGERRVNRKCVDCWYPLGSYYCGSYSNYLYRRKELPSKKRAD